MTTRATITLFYILFAATSGFAETPVDNRLAAGERDFASHSSIEPGSASSSPGAIQRSGSTAHELLGADRPVQTTPGEHPLTPALRWAKEGLSAIEHITDYSATLMIRERIGSKLSKRQTYLVKIRHEPFSVYTYGLGPAAIKGEEALYVQGHNDGKLWGHAGGMAGSVIPTMSLDPKGELAMRDHRYPMTEIGILNLMHRMISVAENEREHGECQVKYFAGGSINDRSCSWLQVVHPVERPYFRFNVVRIFVDDQLKIPVRYEAYGWPQKSGGTPVLLEEYSYVNMKINNGFADQDFSIKNPAYHFH